MLRAAFSFGAAGLRSHSPLLSKGNELAKKKDWRHGGKGLSALEWETAVTILVDALSLDLEKRDISSATAAWAVSEFQQRGFLLYEQNAQEALNLARRRIGKVGS